MVIDRRKAVVLASAAAFRLMLYFCFPALPDLLVGRVEISTPVTSFKRLQEGVFLYTHNVSPYDGGVFHQAPLLLPLFAAIPPRFFSITTIFIYVLLDLLAADALMTIAESGESRSTRLFKSPRKDILLDGASVGAA